ncbi:MAG TPA: SpoVR family protein [Oligoflexia bacterium]|nr:SpoVR family protein [Oligoflexia bacterium]HMR24365.1 SpoVR family protein [Oligoflexia bacterium]
MANLNVELTKIKENIEDLAKSYGLDFCKTVFQMLDYDQLNQVASYGGFPVRYPHWSFGMTYEELSKGYTYGVSKIYELVINNDPCIAYLMKSNSLLDQKLVMAHVYGHADFFKNNQWFSKTNRKMVDEMANHATRIRRYIDKYGFDEVEQFIDVCKSLDNLIDIHLPFKNHGSANFKLPREHLKRSKKEKSVYKQRDVIGYLAINGKLKDWQSEIMMMLREEAYYFAPQAQTKIMNEGWASYWHSKMMTQHILKDAEIIEYADHHAGTMAAAKGQMNPYKLGIELFRDIENRWNKGKFGKDYEECNSLQEKNSWNKDLGLGREKIFEVRRVHNDVNFIENFMTMEFCQQHKLFMFAENHEDKSYNELKEAFDKFKQQFVVQLSSIHGPPIYIVDENDKSEQLFLEHQHEGVDLKQDWAKETLKNIFLCWGKPVSLLTVVSEKETRIYFDGKSFEYQQ